MELIMTAMMKVHPVAKYHMQKRVNLTLGDGKAPTAAPTPTATHVPTQAPTQVTDTYTMSHAMVTAMQRSKKAECHRQTKLREELADTFSRGSGIPAKRLTEVSGDPTYKRFSGMKKRKIMGQC